MNAKVKAFMQSKAGKIVTGLVLVAILGAAVWYFYPSKKVDSKTEKNPPTTAVPPPAPIDSTLKKQLDDLNKQFKDYQQNNDARLDSLLNPAWYRELDRKTLENKNKGAK